MAFVYPSSPDVENKVGIVFVPAIYADPTITFDRPYLSDFDCKAYSSPPAISLHEELRKDECIRGSAQFLFYDHLTPTERGLQDRSGFHEGHLEPVEALAAAEEAVARFGVAEWADRFLEILYAYHRSQRNDRKHVILICHSTGGSVVKEALSRKLSSDQSGIAAWCLSATFFSTPHHGSSVLSEPAYKRSVGRQLGLKWEMSDKLLQEYKLRNPGNESLNQRFAVSVAGMKIYNFVEKIDTILEAMEADHLGGKSVHYHNLCIVDSRSGRLSTKLTPVDDEATIALNSNHIGGPHFEGDNDVLAFYIKEIHSSITDLSLEERETQYTLYHDIMNNITIDIHQFYRHDSKDHHESTKMISVHPSLQKFLERGTTECLEGWNCDIKGSMPTRLEPDMLPHIQDHEFPRLTVNQSDDVRPLLFQPVETSSLSPSMIPVNRTLNMSYARDTNTHHPPLGTHYNLMFPAGARRSFRAASDDVQATSQSKSPNRAAALLLPGSLSGIFRWIHVPATHTGWVSHVLSTLLSEQKDPSLHTTLLTHRLWFSQFHRTQNASLRFVRPSAKMLLPSGAEKIQETSVPMKSSSQLRIQSAVYLAYLHWDTFKEHQQQAAIIKQRISQRRTNPVSRDVVYGGPMEHKLIVCFLFIPSYHQSSIRFSCPTLHPAIYLVFPSDFSSCRLCDANMRRFQWQYLTSSEPLHCRRTLDQYKNPELHTSSVREFDQVLYRRTKTRNRSSSSNGRSDDVAKVLMIDQLWLWVLDCQTVATFFSPRKHEKNHDGAAGEIDLRNQIYQDINGDYASKCNDAFDFAALVVYHAIKILLENTTSRDLDIFHVFGKYISRLTELQISSFKQFRDSRLAPQNIASPGTDYSAEDLEALLELRDVEDELNTIDSLMTEQQVVVSEMLTQYRSLNSQHFKGLKGTQHLIEVAQFLNEQKGRIASMLQNTRATQSAFKDLFEMREQRDARIAQELHMKTANQSRAILVFTVVTVIFLPLSFFASVFGINAREWSGIKTNMSLGDIFMYMLLISFAVVVVALLVAFNVHARRLGRRVWIITAKPLFSLLGWRSSPRDPDIEL